MKRLLINAALAECPLLERDLNTLFCGDAESAFSLAFIVGICPRPEDEADDAARPFVIVGATKACGRLRQES